MLHIWLLCTSVNLLSQNYVVIESTRGPVPFVFLGEIGNIMLQCYAICHLHIEQLGI